MTDHGPHSAVIPLKKGEGELKKGNYVEDIFFPEGSLASGGKNTYVNYQGHHSEAKLPSLFFRKQLVLTFNYLCEICLYNNNKKNWHIACTSQFSCYSHVIYPISCFRDCYIFRMKSDLNLSSSRP